MAEETLGLLTVVVQRNFGDYVLAEAMKAGATGATFFYAKGTGVRQKLGLFGSMIEAEKQVILIVAETSRLDAVLDAVTRAGRLDKPGMGFAFVQEVLRVAGFFPAGPASSPNSKSLPSNPSAPE
jgi:nitrogen regulatory protein PII